MFVYENLNPTDLLREDCVIRAIAKAEKKTWLEIFDELVKLARGNYSILNEDVVYEKYLSKYKQITAKSIDRKRKRYTVGQISELDGVYIILIDEHLTVVVDHNIYDIWDCSNKIAITIWKVK